MRGLPGALTLLSLVIGLASAGGRGGGGPEELVMGALLSIGFLNFAPPLDHEGPESLDSCGRGGGRGGALGDICRGEVDVMKLQIYKTLTPSLSLNHLYLLDIVTTSLLNTP